jgi:hypothetical protein
VLGDRYQTQTADAAWVSLDLLRSKPIEHGTVPELQTYLDGIDKTALEICTRQDGTPWGSEVQMQTAVSHYLRDLESDGKIGAGTNPARAMLRA